MGVKAQADLKTKAQDFIVEEVLGFELSGTGEHLWCWVEKINANTLYVARQWALLVGCQRRDISHSGLKDRYAITRQWLCLPAIYGDKLPDVGEGWRIIQRVRHQKKLRVGTHRFNDFVIRLREVAGDKTEIETALQSQVLEGFVNKFGAQRFGRDNLARAQQWVKSGKLPKKREERSLVLSTLRAWLFNQQLEMRESLGVVRSLLVGDRAMLRGSQSYFYVEKIDEDLQRRLNEGDIVPAGWLVGKGENTQEATPSADIRAKALEGYAAEVAYLQRYAQSDWRAMVVQAQQLSWQWEEDKTLVLSFRLPKGCFATTLLEQVFTIRDRSVE